MRSFDTNLTRRASARIKVGEKACRCVLKVNMNAAIDFRCRRVFTTDTIVIKSIPVHVGRRRASIDCYRNSLHRARKLIIGCLFAFFINRKTKGFIYYFYRSLRTIRIIGAATKKTSARTDCVETSIDLSERRSFDFAVSSLDRRIDCLSSRTLLNSSQIVSAFKLSRHFFLCSLVLKNFALKFTKKQNKNKFSNFHLEKLTADPKDDKYTGFAGVLDELLLL